MVLLEEAGQPVEPVYPDRGGADGLGADGHLLRVSAASERRAALFQDWLHTRETQQYFVDFSAQYSAHPQVTCEARAAQDLRHQTDEGRCRRRGEAMAEEIKTHYAKLFKV